MILSDTHTHLYAEEFNADRELLIESARMAGVQRFFLPNIDSSSILPMMQLSERYPDHCFPMMGLHPCSVKENWEEEMKKVESLLEQGKFIAVGEIGLDLYWDKTFVTEQKEVFKRQTALANQYKLPIVIHSRESIDLIFDLLKEQEKTAPCGIFHCFSGDGEQARKAIDLGFSLGIGGVLTFKNSGLDKVVENLPMEHLVLETDAPYLAPAPHRGKRNEPAYLKIIAEKLAALKGISLEEVAAITTANSKKIFGQ